MSALLFLHVYMNESEHPLPRDAAEERERAAAFAAGDDGAGRWFFDRYAGPLYNFALRLAADGEAARELVQEAFAQLLAHRARVDAARGVRNYLWTIAANLWRDQQRRRAVRGGTASLDELAEKGFEPAAAGGGKRDRLEELESFLARAVQALPERERLVVTMAKVNGMPYREIAAVLGTSEKTVQRAMNDALDRLVELMEEHGHARKGEIVWD